MVNTQHPYSAPRISNSTLGIPGPSQADSKQAPGAGLRHAAYLVPTSRRVDGRKYVLRNKSLGFKAIFSFFPLFYRHPPSPIPIILLLFKIA